MTYAYDESPCPSLAYPNLSALLIVMGGAFVFWVAIASTHSRLDSWKGSKTDLLSLCSDRHDHPKRSSGPRSRASRAVSTVEAPEEVRGRGRRVGRPPLALCAAPGRWRRGRAGRPCDPLVRPGAVTKLEEPHGGVLVAVVFAMGAQVSDPVALGGHVGREHTLIQYSSRTSDLVFNEDVLQKLSTEVRERSE